MTKKVKRLSQSQTMQQIQEYISHCIKSRDEKKDSGTNGKITEVLGRAYVNKRLLANDIKSRKSDKVDCKFKGNDNKFHNIEFKTGCGALAYEYDEEYIDIERLLNGVEYIAYNPEYCHTMKVEHQFFVLTRKEFLNLLIDFNPKKPFTWFKLNKSRRQVNIQSFLNSRKKYDYLIESLFDYPTLKEFIEQVK